eukprot:4817468-Prymnesium_polylepis.1
MATTTAPGHPDPLTLTLNPHPKPLPDHEHGRLHQGAVLLPVAAQAHALLAQGRGPLARAALDRCADRPRRAAGSARLPFAALAARRVAEGTGVAAAPRALGARPWRAR